MVDLVILIILLFLIFILGSIMISELSALKRKIRKMESDRVEEMKNMAYPQKHMVTSNKDNDDYLKSLINNPNKKIGR